MKKMPAVWETADVILREIGADDAARIVAWRGDPQVYRYFKSPRRITEEEHRSWYEDQYRRNEDRRDFIVLSKAREPLGTVGVSWQACENTAEVSYLIDPRYRGQGWAGKALAALCEFARTQWAVQAFSAVVHKQNLPSQGFIQAQGFVCQEEDGEFWIYRKPAEAGRHPGGCER